ncbi:collagen binding domain-containing protein, partial [Jeotgalicoccus halotolerans]|uniref:collagen binding domain-containing protein n=1 Tax=Jeotgalicoccus halotolerans TaxID=157227 RepID=UPI0039EFB962
MLASVFQTFVPSSEAKAAELSQENFVDDFSISPDTLTHGEDTRISISFSDKSGNNMSVGDTLTLQVPENLEATRATQLLKNSEGVTFGVCEVSSNQVKCTFNEMVEKLNNIRGEFFYTATAGFVEPGSTVDYTTNLGTNLDGKNYSITALEGGTEPGVFFYKTGDMLPSDPDHVRWFLNANLKKDYLNSDINIQDTIQEGQELVEDSFSITIEDYFGQSKVLTKEEFEAEQYGTVSIHNNMSFNINIYQDKASTNAFYIMYLTEITENGKKQEKFVNNYETDYTILHEEPVSESGTHEVNNRFTGGGVEGDPPLPGTVRIIKTLNNDENLLLENVSFNIFKADGTPVNNGEPIITNNEGMVEVANLPAGEYYLQEISAPNHIEFDENNKIFFTIEPNSDEGLILSINNNIATTSVPVEKVWELQDKEAETVTIHLLADGERVDTV